MTARAWAWVAHLRSGGTTPWAAFAGTGEAAGRFLPGAQQLELLRRLNATGRPSPALAERVVTASAPGRGRPDLELVGVTTERRFGPRPVDPATLPDHELLRVATGLLATSVAAAPLLEAAPPRRVRRRYQLAGDPYLAATWTDHLTLAGRPAGGAGRAVVVLGGDLPTLLARTWVARCLAAGAPPWPEFVARARLPRRIDLPAVAEHWAARPHAGRVAVVLDRAAVARVVGVRWLPPAPDLSEPAAELGRQVGTALSLLVTPDERAERLRAVLRPRLARLPGPPPGVPLAQRDWVEDEAARLHRRLTRASYPVVGDPGAVMPQWADSPAGRGIWKWEGKVSPHNMTKRPPSPLDLAIRLLLEEGR